MAKYTKETDVLFQYSQGFRLIVPNAYKTCHTQFYSVDYPNGLAIAPSSYIVEGGKTYCPVPNQMTVKPNSIIVFAYLLEESRAITESKTVLEVWERPKPPDFVFTPSDTVTYATAAELIEQMEAAVASEEVRATAEVERASAESARASAEASRVSAESARVSAETSRVAAESDRVTAESERAEAETLRETAESERTTAESSRASAEASRVSVEESRVSAEASRTSAESTRVSAETSRSDAESSRVSNESARVAAEASRKSAEASRAEAESSRNTAEESRVTAESSRASAELSRTNAETNRVNAETARQTVESNRTLSEDSRVTAETGRVIAENERQESETARQTAETSRANAESSRANAEATRVSKESARASAEETRQTNEEARASAESSRESAEEARASAESARASAEAKRETKWSNASATAVKGEADADVVITDSGVTFNFKIPQGEKGDPGVRGLTGETGNGISSMTLVSGTHAAGTIDTYRLTFTDGTYQDFTVYNGANGEGSGDMLWTEFNNRLNPSGKNGQIAFEADLTAHTGNTDIHVTASQKTAWSAKYNKPTGGIPKTDLASGVQTSLEKADTALQQHQDISGKADVSALTSHTGDTTIHTSTAEKNTWNGKYTKPSGGIPKTDLASSVQTSLGKADTALQEHQDISGKADASALTAHTGNSDIHVTTANKTAWNAKYNKPSGGIPKTDLSEDVQTSLGKADTALQKHQDISGKADVSALNAHTSDTTIHTSTAEKNTWSAKANKPTTATVTMSSSGWSNGTYSFEGTYPVATYDIEIALDSTATSAQVEAFNGALIVGSATSNIVKAYGIVPTVDIPIVIKVVKK